MPTKKVICGIMLSWITHWFNVGVQDDRGFSSNHCIKASSLAVEYPELIELADRWMIDIK